jgi:hypothetical protein
MNKHWAKMAALVLLWTTIAVAGFGSAVWQLWNLLMPHLFGLPSIGFWQAVGLMALSWLLFGGWRGAGGFTGRRPSGGRHAMTEQERERFRAMVDRRGCT